MKAWFEKYKVINFTFVPTTEMDKLANQFLVRPPISDYKIPSLDRFDDTLDFTFYALSFELAKKAIAKASKR